ncbi:uncharacterized protein K452DRAFT_60293 [Aplosporella prunicola CBS 121167]|uniref:Uncharacterized protein n=1 Tax=Aplosporella prunicola CBS 121167 TaxID=1176127 RepID=A0A6A6B918_9PEZI|nr:uncharacterized protein K452DRAFT_60293 [Aplosporella prunicola CBS 121167]KAF2140068.1 hypothetical protein K452DRAFT_60293 [Aplosporella prunicola CBS 121167]
MAPRPPAAALARFPPWPPPLGPTYCTYVGMCLRYPARAAGQRATASGARASGVLCMVCVRACMHGWMHIWVHGASRPCGSVAILSLSLSLCHHPCTP